METPLTSKCLIIISALWLSFTELLNSPCTYVYYDSIYAIYFTKSSKFCLCSYNSRGNCILVGSLGQELESLASFAFFLAGYNMQCVDFSKEDGFSDGMKSLFRQAGLEGKPIGVIVKVN